MLALTGYLFLALVLAALAAPLPVAVAATALYALLCAAGGLASPGALILLALFTLVLGVLSCPALRRRHLSARVLAWFRKVAPRLSDTEREALEAGTVWWDRELFSGRPDWKVLLSAPDPQLREDERSFLEGPVEELCGMLSEWDIQRRGDLPEEVWQFLKDEGFFGLAIEKRYGGLEFSAAGNSAVVTRIASANLTAAVTVMVPNSLGPGELLRDYGTEAQRAHYLPRLARGEEIPCFALTNPYAGSDAASIPDTGVVCYGEWQGERVLGLRLNWDKRYITLAPVATLIGLAFRARDPDRLLGGEEDLGITCALVPADLPGVWIGNRHFPVGAVFMNGPTRGRDVFIPLEQVIGGREGIGQGWKMLMQSLAAGRAISLPALGTAGTQYAAKYTGQYARIRRQFGMPVAFFEGVEEVLARLAAEAYRVDAARRLTLAGIELGERPSVLSAILKYHATEANRRSVVDAMDVHGGKGIITGPNNYLAQFYQTLPIAITVEGANILTRSLIVFGQGVIRNHPYLQQEIAAAGAPPSEESLRAFDRAFFGHIGFFLSNLTRTLLLGLTGARLVRAPVVGRTAHYYRQLTRMSAAFAAVADTLLVTLGGRFKFKEKLSGRMADVLIHLYLASAVLKRYEDEGRPREDHPLVHWAVRDSLVQIQEGLLGVLRNLPIPGLGALLRWVIFPWGRAYRHPSDRLGRYAARILYTPGPARDRLLAALYRPKGNDPRAVLDRAFAAVLATAAVEKRVKQATRSELNPANARELTAEAVATGAITAEEAEALLEAWQLVGEVIRVDDFPPGERWIPSGGGEQ
ncbi:MAG: acyl-CoA dehydrogenase [Porticoccaceae bacterium]|nr:MAG: acyl-CoA dehydrogenase [Porticoccaceae bacterium]